MTNPNIFLDKNPKPQFSYLVQPKDFETLKQMYNNAQEKINICTQRMKEILEASKKKSESNFKRQIDLYRLLYAFCYSYSFKSFNDLVAYFKCNVTFTNLPNDLDAYKAYLSTLLLYLDIQNEETLLNYNPFELLSEYCNRYPQAAEYMKLYELKETNQRKAYNVLDLITFGEDAIIVNIRGKLKNLTSGQDYDLSKDDVEFLTKCAKEKNIMLENITEDDIPFIREIIKEFYRSKEENKPKNNYNDIASFNEIEDYYLTYKVPGSLYCEIQETLNQKKLELK